MTVHRCSHGKTIMLPILLPEKLPGVLEAGQCATQQQESFLNFLMMILNIEKGQWILSTVFLMGCMYQLLIWDIP